MVAPVKPPLCAKRAVPESHVTIAGSSTKICIRNSFGRKHACYRRATAALTRHHTNGAAAIPQQSCSRKEA